MREAFAALDFVLVIDVRDDRDRALCRLRAPGGEPVREVGVHVLHAGVPAQLFHLRRPLFEPLPGTLPEPEIHARLVRALGGYTDDDLAPLHAAAAARVAPSSPRRSSPRWRENPAIGRNPGLVLYETLGPVLGEGNRGRGRGVGARQHLLPRAHGIGAARRVRARPTSCSTRCSPVAGVTFTVDDYDETWTRHRVRRRARAPRAGRAARGARRRCRPTARRVDDAFPFVLSAGERRSSTANTILRDPALDEGRPRRRAAHASRPTPRAWVWPTAIAVTVETKRSSAVATVEIDRHDAGGARVAAQRAWARRTRATTVPTRCTASRPNELTDEMDRDWLARHAAPQARPRPHRGARRCRMTPPFSGRTPAIVAGVRPRLRVTG